MVSELNHNRFVDRKKFTPRQILRRNVLALMGSDTGPTSQLGLRQKCGVAQSTIGRILSAEGENAKIETVERIAHAYGLEGWQLLIAGMDPKNPPVLAPMTKVEKEFYKRLRQLYQEVGKGVPE